jgi:thioredoxin 1
LPHGELLKAAAAGKLASMDEPTRDQVDAFTEPTVLEFGTSWCGYCRAAQPDITTALRKHPSVRHIKVEDGKGRPLGRSFGVKLWPTLVYLEAGVEKGRVVRPNSAAEIEAIFAS